MAVAFKRVTPSPSKRVHAVGDCWVLFGFLTFSGTYPTGGETLDVAAAAREAGGRGKEVFLISGDIRGNSVEYMNATGKLKLFSAANTELAAGAYNAAITAADVPVAFLMTP